jgi:hypothetical protein
MAAQAAAATPAAGPLSIANCKAYAVREPVSKRQYARPMGRVFAPDGSVEEW